MNFDLSGKTFLSVDPLFRRLLGRTEPSPTSGAGWDDLDPVAPEGLSEDEVADLASPDPLCTSMGSASSTRILLLLGMGEAEEEEETTSPSLSSWLGSSFRRPSEGVDCGRREGSLNHHKFFYSHATSRIPSLKFPSHWRPSNFTNQYNDHKSSDDKGRANDGTHGHDTTQDQVASYILTKSRSEYGR